MKFLLPALLSGLLLGCQASTKQTLREGLVTDELKDPTDSLAVSLRVMVPTAQGERQLTEGEKLPSKDPFSLVVRVSKPAYLYVVHFGQDGSVDVLFPNATYQMAPASCPMRLPQRRLLYAQGPTGTVDLHVVASLRPLGEVDSRMCEELRLPCESKSPATPLQTAPCSTTPLPPPVVFKNRVIFPNVKVSRDQGQGVASVRFSVRHVP